MTPPSSWEREAAKITSEVARRAIRRLDVLEWVILAAAVGLAVGGGALVAWLIATPSGLGFQTVWIATSVLLLVVPGAIVFTRIRREDREREEARRALRGEDDG